MSDTSKRADAVKVSPSDETPSPKYFYQVYQGKAGGVSARPANAPHKVFEELQNFHVASA